MKETKFAHCHMNNNLHASELSHQKGKREDTTKSKIWKIIITRDMYALCTRVS